MKPRGQFCGPRAASFQEEGDRSYISVRELNLYEEATLDDWMANHGPGAQKTG